MIIHNRQLISKYNGKKGGRPKSTPFDRIELPDINLVILTPNQYGSLVEKYGYEFIKKALSILENNCMQSTSSASGYSTGSTLVSAFAALVMINGEPMNTWLVLCWVFFMAILGVTMAIPMKRSFC